MNSCIYAGLVRHRRFLPVLNQFRYRIFMMYIDLDEIDQLFSGFWLWSTRRRAPAWFRRRDHYGDAGRPLDACIRELVARETGRTPQGAIRLLTHLRYFGYCFNPISIYYCFDRENRIQDVVLEVSNTPCGETHCYVLPRAASDSGNEQLRFDFAKNFHVSPFLPMDMSYRCRITAPGERLSVGIENWRQEQRVFDAHLALEREPITHRALARQLAMDPLVTLRVMLLIHWQGLRLWAKRAPFFSHSQPTTRVSSSNP